MLYADKFPAVLPYGLDVDGTRVREFEVLQVDGVFEDIFTHQTYRARHPQKWTSLCGAAILSSLGNADIRHQFTALKYGAVPSLLKKLNLHDLSYILLCGHVHTYGPTLPAVQYQCPKCTFTGTVPVDLREMKLDFDTEHPREDTVLVDLPNGWTRRAEPGKAPLGVEDKTWNRFLFGFPTIQNAEDNELYYNAKNLAEFNLRLAQSALRQVYAVAHAPGGAVTELAEMSPDNLAVLRRSICLDLKGLDRQTLRRAFRGANILNLDLDANCTRCDAELPLTLDIGELYPLA